MCWGDRCLCVCVCVCEEAALLIWGGASVFGRTMKASPLCVPLSHNPPQNHLCGRFLKPLNQSLIPTEPSPIYYAYNTLTIPPLNHSQLQQSLALEGASESVLQRVSGLVLSATRDRIPNVRFTAAQVCLCVRGC